MTNVFNDTFSFSIVPSRLQRTVLENHTVGSFMNVRTFFSNSMARVERINDGVCSTPEYRIRGGDFPASTVLLGRLKRTTAPAQVSQDGMNVD